MTSRDRARPPAHTGGRRVLNQIIEVTSADLELREVACRVAALVTEATASDVCFVHLVDEDRQCVVLVGATPPFDELSGTIELPLGEGVAGWVALHARPAVVPDKWADPRYRYIPALRGEDYASLVSVPMVIRGGSVLGVLNIHSKRPRNYGSRDLTLLGQVASLMARTVEHARLYDRLAEREERLARFATRTVEVAELERRRLAGEIHDGISQRLVSLWYHLLAAEDAAGMGMAAPADATTDAPPTTGDAATAAVGHGALLRELAVAKVLVTAAMDEARTAISGLRPSVLDDLGLAPGLESLARSLSGVVVDLDLEPCALAPHVEVALYRIAQEALQNVAKHAGATRVSVRLTAGPDGVRLVVTDDGGGFDPTSTGDPRTRLSYGLAGMHERAEVVGAELSVVSRPGEGTTVEAFVGRPA